MFRLIPVFVGLAGLVFTTGVSAQAVDSELAKYASCAVSNYPSETKRFRRSDIKLTREKRAARAFGKSTSECVNSKRASSTPFTYLRAELARAVFLLDEKLVARISEVPVETPTPNLGILPTKDSREILTVKYASCLAKSDPGNALSFVLTKRGSDAEKAGTSEIDGFVDCMPHMSMMNVSIQSLKDHLAIQLFRIVSEDDA